MWNKIAGKSGLRRSPGWSKEESLSPEIMTTSSVPASDPFWPDNHFTGPMFEKLRRHPKRIVFPEGEDGRILRVAEKAVRREILAPILLGDRDKIRALAEEIGVSLEGVGLLEPEQAEDFEMFCRAFEKMERYRRMKVANAAEVIARPHYFAAMMAQYGQADGVVGGNTSYPATVLRALFHVHALLPHVEHASSCSILLDAGSAHFGKEGYLFLADCAVIPEPSVEQLAMIGVESGKLARFVLGRAPKVAFLSFSTKGSATAPATERVVAAAALARERAHEQDLTLEIDGEMQVDAALVPEIAALKAPGSRIQGDADVLVFPNLNSGNISFKLLQHAAGAQPYGNLILGLGRPAAQISRGASPETILGTAAAVGIQAIEYHLLYPAG